LLLLKMRRGFSATGKFPHLEFADREKKKAFVESMRQRRFHNQAAAGVESALSWHDGAHGGLHRSRSELGRELKSKEKWDAKLDLNKLR